METTPGSGAGSPAADSQTQELHDAIEKMRLESPLDRIKSDIAARELNGRNNSTYQGNGSAKVCVAPSAQPEATIRGIEDKGKVNAALLGAANATAFGQGPRVFAFFDTALTNRGSNPITGDNSFADRYSRNLAANQQEFGDAAFTNPTATKVGEFAPLVAAPIAGGVKKAAGNIIFSKLEKKAAESVAKKELATEAASTAPKAAEPVAAGEPVSVATGEYLETWRDFFIPGAPGFDGARYMGLKLPDAPGWRGPLGACQISAFDEYFDNPEPGQLDFHQADGKSIRFARPFNFLPSENAAFPHLQLKAPWLKKLELKDRRIVKSFRQYKDGFYRLEKISDLSGNGLSFARDARGALLEIVRDDGVKLVFANDAEGRRREIALIGVDGARLELARYAYDAAGRMSEARCAFGMSVSYDWHETLPLLMRWRNRTGRSETVFSYDAQGRVLHTRTSGLWNNDRFVYDGARRVTTYLPAGDDARAQTFEYDAHDNVVAEIDALGGATRHVFDRLGFRTATTDANGNATRTSYDIWGNVKSHRDAEGRETIYGRGPEGQLDVVVDGAGNVRRNEYDGAGNLTAEIDAEKHRTEFERDGRGRIIRTRLADGCEERRAYDARGWLIGVRDAKGGVTRFAHDAFGRVISLTNALGGETRFSYEACAGGFATPTRMILPDGTSVSRGYDAEGALAEVVDGEGRRWCYRYGAFDVLESVVDPAGGELRLAYDSEGRLLRVVNPLGAAWELRRDAAGRLAEEIDFEGRRTGYLRDAAGRLVEATKPDGAQLVYAYDKSGLVTGIEAFDARGAQENAVSYVYDRRGLLIEARNRASRVEYIRDRNGRIVEEDIDGRRVKSRYDALGRRIERRVFTGIDQPHETRLGEHATR